MLSQKKSKSKIENREEMVVNGVKVIKPIITYEGSIVRGDEESLEENTKRNVRKMAEMYQEMKIFYKTYENNDRLELLFFLNEYPAIAEDTTPDKPPNEEMKKDKKYFRDRRYNENLLKELKQRGFLRDQ